jgi:hypothetical protein
MPEDPAPLPRIGIAVIVIENGRVLVGQRCVLSNWACDLLRAVLPHRDSQAAVATVSVHELQYEFHPHIFHVPSGCRALPGEQVHQAPVRQLFANMDAQR